MLRSALICSNAIGSLDNNSLDERSELYKVLDEVMKNKLIELNPCFSEETLNNMICTYKRGYIIYPMDIIVIDDAVFHKEAVLDDFSIIHEIRTFMFEGMRPYYSISEIDFIVYESDIFSSERDYL